MNRTLSKNEAQIVLDLEWRGEKTATLEHIRRIVGASDGYARHLAHGLVKKGWLERLRPGLFQLVPADRGVDGVADTNPLAAGAVLAAPYFFSFGTACTHHGLTEQRFAEVYVACRQRRPAESIRAVRYVFVHVRANRFFGFEETSALGSAVQMATLERALLDAIDRPQFAGGMGEVSSIVGRAARRVSWRRLVEYARAWNSSALVQRLGYYLDLHQAQIPAATRSAMLRLIVPHSKIHVGSRRRWGTTGRLAKPWNVVENVPRDVLLSGNEKPGRRVVLPSTGPVR
ncbi:MAG: type IV toxin-antitoxin system AbiEi family antitoxin [Acidobacteriota bacterium]